MTARRSAAAVSDVPSAGARLGIAQRKLALVKSATANYRQRGDRDVNIKDLFDGILEATDEAFQQVFTVAESKTLRALLEAPAPDDDQLDQLGSALIDEAQTIVDRHQAAAARWNEDSLVLDVAWRARGEVGDYTALHRTVASVNGLLELLVHLTESVESGAEVNWTVIQSTIQDARDRLGPAYCAAGILAELDQDVDDEDAKAS